MAGLVARQISHKLLWRPMSSLRTKKPYWLANFPDGRTRSFDEIPLIEEKNYDLRKYHEVSMEWFRKYGYVAKEVMPDSSYTVHLFHLQDFKNVYYFGEDLYSDMDVKIFWNIQKEAAGIYADALIKPLQYELELVSEDFVKILDVKVVQDSDLDILPLLYRWAFESTGVLALNERLKSLSESGSEDSQKMIQAVLATKGGIGVSTSKCHPEIQLRRILEAQNDIYRLIIQYVDEKASKMDNEGIVKDFLDAYEGDRFNAILATLELFKGTLQAVPLTVLMTLYNLAQNKHVQDSVREKLVKQLPSRRTKYFSTEGFNKGIPRYLSSLVFETLRMFPPIIGNGRALLKDLVLGGYQVPKDVNMILHYQAAFRMEENFKEPFTFIPQRHPTSHQLHLEYVLGRRQFYGLGKNFVFGQIILVLAKILRNFEVSYHGKELDINLLHIEPRQPIFLKLTPFEKTY